MSIRHQQDSAMSSPVLSSVYPSSVFDMLRQTLIASDTGDDSIKQGKLVHPEFAFSDGSVEVETRDQLFWIHEYQIQKFSKLTQLLKEARATSATSNYLQRTKLSCEASGIDVANTLRIIYASVINGPFHCDKDVLISALRIATTYGYSELRQFAIAGLEKAYLTAIDRIRLSDEFVLPSWEKPAFNELCQRPEAITRLEAQVLGMGRFVEIARIREAEQRHQLVGSLVESAKKHCTQGARKNSSTGRSSEGVRPLGSFIPSQFPPCNCAVKTTVEDGIRHRSVDRCKIHEIAPLVLAECQSLLKERNKLLVDMNYLATDLVSHVSKAQSDLGGSAGANQNGYVSLENGLAKAAWIRPLHAK